MKFVDRPGLSQNYVPHIDIRINRNDNSILTCQFDVRTEPNSRFWHEWRDWVVDPYIVGPNVRIYDGKLVVNGAAVTDIPTGVWVHIKISCPIGKKANGKWDLSVQLPGKEEQVFKGLRLGMEAFKRVSYFNFVAEAETDAVFYVDNVSFK